MRAAFQILESISCLAEWEHLADDRMNPVSLLKLDQLLESISWSINKSLQSQAATQGEKINILLLSRSLSFPRSIPNAVNQPTVRSTRKALIHRLRPTRFENNIRAMSVRDLHNLISPFRRFTIIDTKVCPEVLGPG